MKGGIWRLRRRVRQTDSNFALPAGVTPIFEPSGRTFPHSLLCFSGAGVSTFFLARRIESSMHRFKDLTTRMGTRKVDHDAAGVAYYDDGSDLELSRPDRAALFFRPVTSLQPKAAQVVDQDIV